MHTTAPHSVLTPSAVSPAFRARCEVTRKLVAPFLAVIAFTQPLYGNDFLVIDAVVLRPLVEAEAPARQTGVLAEIKATEGAVVKKNDLLASLDSRAAELAVAKADLERQQALAKVNNELRIEYADKALEVARAELARSLDSNKKFPNSVSASQLDVERLTAEKLQLERRQAMHELELDRFELQLKETELKAAQLHLELHSVRAPFDGVVALVRGRVGEWVEPGVPLLRLVAVDRLRAEGFAPASAIASLEPNTAVNFVPEVPDKDGNQPPSATTFSAVLRYISPEIDPVNRQVRIWAEVDNSQSKLMPGQRGSLQISR